MVFDALSQVGIPLTDGWITHNGNTLQPGVTVSSCGMHDGDTLLVHPHVRGDYILETYLTAGPLGSQASASDPAKHPNGPSPLPPPTASPQVIHNMGTLFRPQAQPRPTPTPSPAGPPAAPPGTGTLGRDERES